MKYLTVLSLFAFSGAYGVTLEEAIVAAYNNNAGWLAAQSGRNAASAQSKQADSVFFPTLEGTLTTARNGEESRRWSGDRTHRDYDVLKSTSTQMALRVRQNLFNGFQDVNNALSKKHAAKAAYHALKKAEQDLLVKVIQAYTSVWFERQKLKAHSKKEENLKKLYESQKICLTAGMATPADVAEAESRYQTAVYERVDAETQVIAAEATFKQITGLDADNNMNIPNLKIKMPKNLQIMKQKAMVFNQEILQAKFAEKSALKDLAVSKGAAFGPKCELTFSAGRHLNRYEPRYESENNSANNYSAELAVTVPILNMPSYAGIKYYSEKAKQAKFSLEDKTQEVNRNCDVYWRTYIAAEASIRASRTAVKSAEITSESNLNQSTFGMKSNTEFLDGETSLLTARINLAKAIKNKIDVQVQLISLTGGLDLVTVLSASGNKYAS